MVSLFWKEMMGVKSMWSALLDTSNVLRVSYNNCLLILMERSGMIIDEKNLF